jgi:hypothetical protein
VVTSKTLAMRFRDKHVENKEVLEGSEQLVLVHQGKRVELRFALYAVPPIA